MAFFTAKKRGKRGSRPGSEDKGSEHTPVNMYSAVEFGSSRPGSERRFTNIYGKNTKARRETDVQTGEESRRAGRMFNWMKGESY
jgi:hypothetical protein